MKPTTRLRFVEREIEIPDDPFGAVRKYKVLQQWYSYDILHPTEKGEWKDVPLEKENV